jgi:hypothetical protein
MLWIVGDHHCEVKIADSKEIIVAIAYGMPFELAQFALFHVLLHINTTSDTNKKDHPLLQLL